jgi:hypothetical protein
LRADDCAAICEAKRRIGPDFVASFKFPEGREAQRQRQAQSEAAKRRPAFIPNHVRPYLPRSNYKQRAATKVLSLKIELKLGIDLSLSALRFSSEREEPFQVQKVLLIWCAGSDAINISRAPWKVGPCPLTEPKPLFMLD